MTQAHINRLENDRMKPRAKTLERLAEAFNTPIEELTLAVAGPVAADWAKEDPELLSLFRDIASLPEADRDAVKRTLSLIAKQSRIQQVIAS